MPGLVLSDHEGEHTDFWGSSLCNCLFLRALPHSFQLPSPSGLSSVFPCSLPASLWVPITVTAVWKLLPAERVGLTGLFPFLKDGLPILPIAQCPPKALTYVSSSFLVVSCRRFGPVLVMAQLALYFLVANSLDIIFTSYLHSHIVLDTGVPFKFWKIIFLKIPWRVFFCLY